MALAPPLQQLIVDLPKGELHVHLEGSIQPPLAARLASKHGLRIPGLSGDGTNTRHRFTDFYSFVRLYLAVSACLVDANDIADTVEDLGRQHAEQNVRYAEVTFTPMTHIEGGVSADQIVAGLREGRTRARERHGVELRWVFDVVCSLPDQGEPTLEMALRVLGDDPGAVVGLGLGGPEPKRAPIEALASVFGRAKAEGLRSLPHAGELAGADNIWDAIRYLRADRIGHGIRCLEDPALVEHLREQRIVLEVCPGSNVALGVVTHLADHPLPRLLDEGLAVTLASDDPGLFDTSLTRELSRAAEVFGWDEARIREIAAMGFEGSCLEDARIRELRAAQDEIAPPRA